MRRSGLLGFLVLLLLVGAVGAVSYNLGRSTGAAEAAIGDGATVVYAPGGGFSPFGIIAGLFFLVLIIGFIAKAFAGPRMGMGPGYWGHRGFGRHGDWHGEDVPEPFRPMLERWHLGAHGGTSNGGPDSQPTQRPAPDARSGPGQGR